MLGWSDWKTYPNAARGENIEAPIGPGLFEVRETVSGALFAFDSVDNIALALAAITTPPSRFGAWFSRRPGALPQLEYRIWATPTKAAAKAAAERMIGRRETYMRGAAA